MIAAFPNAMLILYIQAFEIADEFVNYLQWWVILMGKKKNGLSIISNALDFGKCRM